MGWFDFFGGGAAKQQRLEAAKQQRLEEERLASEEARAKAAEAAHKRQEQFEKSAAGIASKAKIAAAAKQAKAQIAAAEKQSSNAYRGGPTLKWQVG